MSFSRALAGFLVSSRAQKWPLLRPAAAAALRSSPFSTEKEPPEKRSYSRRPKTSSPEKRAETAAAAPSELPRPSEIPFQPRVANSVHLVGTIGIALELETSPDGVCAAVSVLIQEKTNHSPHLWIPVIFQGDLAQIAACHLKENDRVYVTGQLSGDRTPHLKDVPNIQVLANSLCFVEKDFPGKGSPVVDERENVTSDHSASLDTNLPTTHFWNDLISNPHNWWDNRTNMSYPTSAAFKHKDSDQLLWVNDSTPEWVLPKLDKLFSSQTMPKTKKIGKHPREILWNDLVANPQQWWDKRKDKLNGSVNPRSPDFKHKTAEEALWLDSAPDWVLPKLDRSESVSNISRQEDVTLIRKNGKDCVSKSLTEAKVTENRAISKWQSDGTRSRGRTSWSKTAESDNLWKDLVENPNKWWDNRSNKLNPKSPDFKHKDNGKGLWLSSISTPKWVRPKLPPCTAKQNIGGDCEKAATLLS